MHGVDVVIAECSMPEGDVIPSHLSPERLARLASAANPGLLIATRVYPRLERTALPEAIRKAGWGWKFVVAEEGLTLN